MRPSPRWGDPRTAAWGDYEGDGHLDLAVADSVGPTRIYRNDGNAKHWLHVDLIGTQSNRFGIGARIEIVVLGNRQVREVSASAGYLGENSITAEFGLGFATAIDSVIVTWPTGVRQVVTPPAVDQRVVVTESSLTGVDDRPARPILLANRPNPFAVSTKLRYDLPSPGRIQLDIIDLSGRRVRTLAAGSEAAGRHDREWDGRSDRGTRVPPGVYLLRLRSKSFEVTRRMVFIPLSR